MKKRALKIKLVLNIIVIFLLLLALSNNLIIGNSSNIVSFGIIHFLSYLFFLLLPAELFFIYFLAENSMNQLIALSIAIITALLAQITDYAVGYLSANNIAEIMKPERYSRYRKFLIKYGYPIIFIFNLTPLSSPIIVLVAGIMKLRLRKVMLVSFLGLTLKYTIILIFFNLLK